MYLLPAAARLHCVALFNLQQMLLYYFTVILKIALTISLDIRAGAGGKALTKQPPPQF